MSEIDAAETAQMRKDAMLGMRHTCEDVIDLIDALEKARDARPAPSQSDEERAANLEKYARYSTKADSEEMKVVYLRALAAVRAEATLAGAAAEREACAKIADDRSRSWAIDPENQDEILAGEGERIAAAIRARKP